MGPARPQAKLEWHFMEQPVYSLMAPLLPPGVTCVHTAYAYPVSQA